MRFTPEVGEIHQYRIGLRVGIAPGESVFDRAVVLQSVVRYRVTNRDDGRTTLRVEPRYMVGKMGHRILFDSTRAHDSNHDSFVAAMRSGFDLVVDSDGHTQLAPADGQAWNELMKQGAIRRVDQLKQQLNTPGVLAALPARVGATRTTGGFQTLPKIKLTVTDVSPDSIVVAIDRAADAQPVHVPIKPGGDETVTMTLERLHGRMHIARESGWIESLALVADQTGAKDDRTIPLHLDLSMQALPDDPAAGDMRNSLDGFERVAELAGDDEDMPGYPLHLPQNDEETRPVSDGSTAPAQLFPRAGATFRIDARHHELILRAPFNIEKNRSTGHIALAGLSLIDAQGKTLDLPMVVDTMRYDLVDDKIGIRTSLRPLGWSPADLSAIHEVRATFAHRGFDTVQHTGIELADHPTELRQGDGVARAIPIEGKPHRWRIELRSQQSRFFVDRSQSYGALEVRNTNRRYGERLAPAEAGLIDRAVNPLAERTQLMAEGEAERFPLGYVRYDDTADRLPVTFTDEALRYHDRSTPPPDTHHLFGLADIPKQAISLDDVALRDAKLHRLRLRLPTGVGEACELKAEGPPVHGRALVWQARSRAHHIGDDDSSAARSGMQDWELATEDGVRRYFYDITVDTRLHCAGRPHWQRDDYHHGKTPWLVELAEVIGHPVDPKTPATTFFARMRFLDKNGKPLRPMRLDVQPDDHLSSWHREAEHATLEDYLAEDGTVRFWGRVAAVQTVRFSGEPIDKHWHTEFGGYE